MVNDNLLMFTLMKHFDFGNNMVLQYAVNFGLMALIPLIGTQAGTIFRYIWALILAYFAPVQNPKRAALYLRAIHKQDGTTEASRNVRAWLWHIRTNVVKEK